MSYGLQLCAGPQCRLREGQHSVLSKPILPQPIESKFRMRYLDADVKSYGKFVSAIPPRIKVGDKLIPQFFKFPPPGFPLPMPPIIIPLPPRKEKIMDDNPLLYISEKRLEELKKKKSHVAHVQRGAGNRGQSAAAGYQSCDVGSVWWSIGVGRRG